MKAIRLLALALFAAPVLVFAQPTRPLSDFPLSREELRDCMDRDANLRDRLEWLDQERIANDHEAELIARVGNRLADELRTLDASNAAAVAAYNARSSAHNRRVDAHNRRVAEANGRASMHNGDAANLTARCASRVYTLRDRDAVMRSEPPR
jgi:biotin-(acetyl-CoA carboxylase) ligase